ncbi:MAG TPA: methyltransferase domain-containing protein [Acidimicrobiales bacterium]|nr:methyltransferase domain-containing protein [Acidimicrobiales bacterium]
MTRVAGRWFGGTYAGRLPFVEAHLPAGPCRLLGVGNVGVEGFSSWARIRSLVTERGGTATGCDLGPAKVGGLQVQGDLVRLPLRSAAFDVVYLGEVIEHLWEPLRGLCEARRVLVPGGRLLLDTPNSLSLNGILNWSIRQVDDLGDPDHKQTFTPASLLGYLEAAGFAVDEMATDRKLAIGRHPVPWVPGWRRLGPHLLVVASAA